MSEVDLAYQILKEKGEPMYFRELIDQVLQHKPMADRDDARAMANVYTLINLDTRFIHAGQGQWGLKHWLSGKSQKPMPAATLLNTSNDYEEQELDLISFHDHEEEEIEDGEETIPEGEVVESMKYLELMGEEDWE